MEQSNRKHLLQVRKFSHDFSSGDSFIESSLFIDYSACYFSDFLHSLLSNALRVPRVCHVHFHVLPSHLKAIIHKSRQHMIVASAVNALCSPCC